VMDERRGSIAKSVTRWLTGSPGEVPCNPTQLGDKTESDFARLRLGLGTTTPE